MNLLLNKKKYFFYIIILMTFSFFINVFFGSRGVYPVDTFIHFDQGFRILKNDHPVKDYWIVHGFFVDYMQAMFFSLFGENWKAYVYHASFLNSAVCVSSFLLFKKIKKSNVNDAFIISIFITLLAYPVSGTPFLDLHSSFFSLFGIYFIIAGIILKKNYLWFVSSIFFSLGFLSKQVPAFYIIFLITVYGFYYSYSIRNIRPILNFCISGILCIFTLYLFLIMKNISVKDFILQVILFPKSIGESRYGDRTLNINNIFFDLKLIYIVLIPYIYLNILEFKNKNNFASSKNFHIFIAIILFVISSMFHQIYTKNQIYIFFLIPIISIFFIYTLENYELKNKTKYLSRIVILLFCLVVTLKYSQRFNVERKFHELANTKIENAINFSKFDKKFEGLKWISPYFNDPNQELKILNKMKNIIANTNDSSLFISEYNFFSLSLGKNLHGLSRTYDSISYPMKNSKYFKNYQTFVINKLQKNEIKLIYIFQPKLITKKRLSHLIYDYVPASCFIEERDGNYIAILTIRSCKELNE